MKDVSSSHRFQVDYKTVIKELGEESLHACLGQMFLIRHFELRAEAAYQQGKIGGFFHAYIGQEAIQTAAVQALGGNHWYSTSYRCHALALLLGATPEELMAELFGKVTGNAKGRGGSMHFFTNRLLGGFGIVAGQVPIGTGAGFSIKYRGKKDEVSICFMGDGAVAQGNFHESLNLASLWNLPCFYVIENNQWGMGTAVNKAICVSHIAESQAPSYNMKGYSLDGMDFFACYEGFKHLLQEVLTTQRPVLIEVTTQRFKGHSISDPALYRTKDSLKQIMQRDPLVIMQNVLLEAQVMTEEQIKFLDKEMKDRVMAAVDFADKSSWPDPQTLEEDVLA